MRYSPKNHKWAVIQSGYCVFGTGRAREAAIADSLKWFDATEPWKTIQEVKNHLVRRSDIVNGSLYITNDAVEICQYVEKQ